eukprot:gnl/TRDRNA2_/TRDRNA2_169350_c10_seq1.p1 gnl/TRDRNA2_/TRDRNA2_169350_c10~~gnl/TRDRNA2_/TRDRNA2_169350_c10_seq1.p1  ORF type:complete len:250 (+),score=4.76 gnl/TRDRNA2_/TRDRNA2_169350_c10_seq1:75-752(+)
MSGGGDSLESSRSCGNLCRQKLLIRTAAISVCWIAGCLSYFGLAFSAGNLSSDLYANMGLLALVDVVGYFLPAPLVVSLGRVGAQKAAFSTASALLIICSFLHRGSLALLGCVLCGRLAVDVAFSTNLILSMECFPTECRSTAFGVSQFAGRFGTLFAPFMSLIPATIACPIFGSLCVLAAACTCLLPETSGRGMEPSTTPTTPSKVHHDGICEAGGACASVGGG